MEVPQKWGHLHRMRMLRPYLPGSFFHLTARTSNREPWLKSAEVKEFALLALSDALIKSDAQLCAFSVMTTHLHIVLRQGAHLLSQFMQPVLRRIALRVHKAHDRKGAVFSTPFWARACTDPDYLRTIILYTHINPPRDRLCSWDDDFGWSSHGLYAGSDCARTHNRLELEQRVKPLLDVFALGPNRTLEELRADYLVHFNRERARFELANEGAMSPPLCTDPGDQHWVALLSEETKGQGHPRPSIDVRDYALQVLADRGSITFEQLLTGTKGGELTEVRCEITHRATLAGHRGKAIADFLRISESAVSQMRRSMAVQTFTRFAPFPRSNG